jgi:glycosyltransferase 2 family protein
LKAAVRVLVAAGLTAYILWKSNPSAVAGALAGADWRLIGVAVLLTLADRALMAYRWVLLLCIIPPGARPPLGEIMRIFFVSTFVGTFLPASVGGDAVRAYSMAKLNVGGGDAVASVFMDRMLGVASILLMAAVGLFLARDLASNRTILAALAVAGAMCAVTLAAIFSAAVARLVGRVLSRLPAAVHAPAARVVESIRRYAAHHGRLATVLAGSVGVQVLRIVQAYFLGAGLGITAPLSAYFAFVPLILLVMLLPVTFNGIGTSQWAFVWFFGRAGVPPSSAFALSVLFVALGVVGNLPGGILYATGGGRGRTKVRPYV